MQKDNKISFWGVFARTMALSYTFFNHWRIWFSYAFLLSVLSLLFCQWSYSCQVSNKGFWCLKDFVVSPMIFYTKTIIYYLLLIFFCLAYACDFYDGAFLNKPFVWTDMFKFNKPKLKKIGFLFMIIVFLVTVSVSAYLIIKKPANPNWMIEFIFFTILFICAVLPLLVMRVSATIGYYLQNLNISCLREVFQRTAGRSYTPVILVLLLIMLIAIINLQGGFYLHYLNVRYYSFPTAFATEIMVFALILFSYSVMIAMFRAEQEQICTDVSRETIEQETQAEENTDVEDVPEKTRKNKKKTAKKSSSTTGGKKRKQRRN